MDRVKKERREKKQNIENVFGMENIPNTHTERKVCIENKRIVTYNGGGHVPPSSKYDTHNLDRANFHSTSARSYPQINVKEKKRTKT